MPPKAADIAAGTEPAPWFRVPDRQFISIEHPCYVKNAQKGVDTLGGERGIREALDPEKVGRPVSLSLHPEDRASQRLSSINRPTNNVLMQITVPKRTGRKRKRDSNDPWEKDDAQSEPRKDGRYLLRSLKDNPGTSDIDMIGPIDQTHVFRTMPDFSYSTEDNHIMQEMKSKILPLQYPLVKDFKLDFSTRHNLSADLLPPPVLSTQQVPASYSYRQNPAVKRVLNPSTNLPQTTNRSMPTKIFTHQVQWDTAEVPSSADPRAPLLEAQPANLIGVVTLLRHIFKDRPIWTRRGLTNQIPDSAPQFLVRHAIAYVAYAMRSGPWRDTYIRLGVDPRSSPSYRIYQTLMLQLVTSKREMKAKRDEYIRSWKPSTDKSSHIFTGKPPFPTDGKSWQLCDLCEDPQLKILVECQAVREVCEPRYFGWYKNGTIAKLKIALKSKAETIMDGQTPDPKLYTLFLQLPEEYIDPPEGSTVLARQPRATESTPTTGQVEDAASQPDAPSSNPELDHTVTGFLPRSASRRELEWAALYRGLCRTTLGTKPKSGIGRLSKPTTITTTSRKTKGHLDEDEDVENRETPSTTAAAVLAGNEESTAHRGPLTSSPLFSLDDDDDDDDLDLDVDDDLDDGDDNAEEVEAVEEEEVIDP